MIDSIPEYIVLISPLKLIKIRIPRLAVDGFYKQITPPQNSGGKYSVMYNLVPGPAVSKEISEETWQTIRDTAILGGWIV